MIGPMENVGMPIFDPVRHWGFDHVVPRVEASGRWANIPICMPPELVDEKITQTDTDIDTLVTRTVTRKLVPNINEIQVKPHFLVGCLWASAEFKTRGKDRGASTDTIDRLKEWIEFHLMVGFDHIYVYDNSGAHTNETSLEETLLSYPGKVTRVDWPSTVCNNNIPAHDSTGERSSQYAAENSCRRYALVLSNSEPSMNSR
jgi:Glycosyltransferase family 92